MPILLRWRSKTSTTYARHLNIKPIPKSVTLIHKVALRNLRIETGHILYSKKVPWSSTPIDFTIKHADMIPQLEYVKSYFSKILGKKTIVVHVTVWKEDGKVNVDSVVSSDLMKINHKSLYVIRSFQIDDFKKRHKSNIKGSILLSDESVDITESNFGNVDSIEKEILLHLLEKDDVRNRLQLKYLSEIMNSDHRLLLTLEPQFGFVFTIIGDEMIHMVWELIDTHATYVWSFAEATWNPSIIKELEAEFRVITAHGRSHYRNFFENREGLFLNIVNHKNNQNPMIDHFGEWRLNLERLFL